MEEAHEIIMNISNHTKPNMTFSHAFQLVYHLSIVTPNEDFINHFCEIISGCLTYIITRNIQDQSTDIISKYSNVWNDFVFFRDCFVNLFKISERITNFSFVDYINTKFCEISQESISFIFITRQFASEFDLYHNDEITQNPQYLNLQSLSRLILFVFPDKTSGFFNLLSINCLQYTDIFIQKSSNLTAPDILTASLTYFHNEINYFNFLFPETFTQNLIQNIYNRYTTTDLFKSCLSYSSNYCEMRDHQSLSLLYELITICEPTNETLNILIQSISTQLFKEDIALPTFGETIKFYNKLIQNSFNDNKYLRINIQRIISQYINKDSRSILKSLISYINKQARNDGNIKNAKPILKYLSYRTEFELLHLRNMIRRLIPLTSKQIEIEKYISKQINETSSNFELKDINTLLYDANLSLDFHINNTLFIRSSLWPFYETFPKCINLIFVTNNIVTKYKKLFSNRILSFPIQHWVIYMNFVSKNIKIQVNGIQAEILLKYNKKNFVVENDFEPNISSEMILIGLMSLSTKKIPILIKDNEKFVLNNEFKVNNKNVIVKLPQKGFIKSNNINKKLNNMKNDAIDSTIARIMKLKKLCNLNELEGLVNEQLVNRYALDHNEFMGRLNDMERRGFVELRNDKKVLYIP